MEAFDSFVTDAEYINKAPWTPDEDRHLKKIVEKYGAKRWNAIAEHVPHRTGKQCRERWVSHISPDIVDCEWTAQEDIELISLQNRLGNKWSLIARFFKGRTPNMAKNRFNKIARRVRSGKFQEKLSQILKECAKQSKEQKEKTQVIENAHAQELEQISDDFDDFIVEPFFDNMMTEPIFDAL